MRPVHLFVLPWDVSHAGGVNEVVVNLYRRMEQQGSFAPRILVTSWAHRSAVTTGEDGRSTTRLRMRAPLPPGSPRAVSLFKWAAHLVPEMARLLHVLRAGDVATVNVHFPSLAAVQLVLACALLRGRPKLVLSFHGQDLAQAQATRGIARTLWRWLIRRADAVVSCSHALRDAIVAFEPSAAARHHVVHNGLDVGHFVASANPGARLHPQLHGHPFILCVAGYEHKKGQDTLVRAFATTHVAHGGTLRLALVGPDRGAGMALAALAQSLGLADDVVFCGEVPHADLHVYYRGAALFALASRVEPFGIVLLEAGALGCPVVATTAGGITEIVTHDLDARLVPPDDPPALAAELARMLADAPLRARLARALHDRVQQRFAWDRAVADYLALAAPAGDVLEPQAALPRTQPVR